jgi:DNA-binding response OmpR family regulator
MEPQYRLLIVDDEIEILNVYRDYFAKRGFGVDVARNGAEGLEKLRQEQFEVAIIDIKMPKMDGMALARQIQEEGIDTNVIILTGHGDKDEAVEAINIGVDAWFEKHNIQLNELLSKVKELAEVMPIDEVRRILSTIPQQH